MYLCVHAGEQFREARGKCEEKNSQASIPLSGNIANSWCGIRCKGLHLHCWVSESLLRASAEKPMKEVNHLFWAPPQPSSYSLNVCLWSSYLKRFFSVILYQKALCKSHYTFSVFLFFMYVFLNVVILYIFIVYLVPLNCMFPGDMRNASSIYHFPSSVSLQALLIICTNNIF